MATIGQNFANFIQNKQFAILSQFHLVIKTHTTQSQNKTYKINDVDLITIYLIMSVQWTMFILYGLIRHIFIVI